MELGSEDWAPARSRGSRVHVRVGLRRRKMEGNNNKNNSNSTPSSRRRRRRRRLQSHRSIRMDSTTAAEGGEMMMTPVGSGSGVADCEMDSEVADKDATDSAPSLGSAIIAAMDACTTDM
jgi:hypothetical protein